MSTRNQNQKIGRVLLLLTVICMFLTDLGEKQYARKAYVVTSDPKEIRDGVIQVFKDPHHEFFGLEPEVVIPISARKPDSEIRYAAFGSSSTWGAALADRDHNAYIWRLSDADQDRGKNFAIRASGPNYSSICLSTMMRDDEFDVIILEYYMMAADGLEALAKRIRERFPEAIIVILRLWAPDRIWQNGDRDHKVNKWAYENGFNGNYCHDPDFKKKFLEKAGDGWDFFPTGESLKSLQERIATDVGAYIVDMPFSNRADGPGGWMEIADHFLASDSFHMGEYGGHVWIRDQVKAIVDRVGVPKERHVGQFSDVDQCYNWLQTGSIDDSLRYSSNASINQMPNTAKFGLEFDFVNGDDGSWIEVENKASQEMSLAIGYMTTGPPPSKYPKVEATVTNGVTLVLEPESSSEYGDKPVHISRSVDLGTIPPLQTTRISFTPLEQSEYPFRLIQVMVTPFNNQNINPALNLGGGSAPA